MSSDCGSDMHLQCKSIVPWGSFSRTDSELWVSSLEVNWSLCPFLKLKKCPEEIDALNMSQELYIQFKVAQNGERQMIGGDHKLNASEKHSSAYQVCGQSFQGKSKTTATLCSC